MTLSTARVLCQIQDRLDWSQPRLGYLPASLYGDRPAPRRPFRFRFRWRLIA